MENILEVIGLTKKYGDETAVNNISFSLEKGKLFAFLGPNGAGKSTTINVLSTLLKCTSGKVKIAGYDLNKQPDEVRRNIGIVFQESIMDNILTVRENLMVRATFYYSSKNECIEHVNNVINLTDMQDYVDKSYGKLSGGQRRRADIARALLNTPKILFLDEPTTGLDPQTRSLVWNMILNLQRKRGMTLFLTTHYMEEAATADYITIIDRGEIVATGTPSNLKEKYSSDILKVVAKEQDVMENYLNSRGLTWKLIAGVYMVCKKTTIDYLDILVDNRQNIESFEVLHGTMDDVFLNITGRNIRE